MNSTEIQVILIIVSVCSIIQSIIIIYLNNQINKLKKDSFIKKRNQRIQSTQKLYDYYDS